MSSLTLHADIQALLNKLRALRAFDAKKWIAEKTRMFIDYMQESKLKGCVVNVSGGVDSAVVLALAMHAKNVENSPIKRVIGLAQPIHSTASIYQRAYEVGKAVGAEVVTVDQSEEETSLHAKVDKAVGIDSERFARGQLRSYMRTPVAYYAAQLMSQSGLPTIVLGTGNFDEDGYLCYFCKAGDGVVDVQLIADLHKSEVFMVGKELNVPSSILEAPPSADLWPGQTDEEELGMPYAFIEVFTEWMKMPEDKQEELLKDFSPEAKDQWDRMAEDARSIHRRNRHKLNFPVNLDLMR